MRVFQNDKLKIKKCFDLHNLRDLREIRMNSKINLFDIEKNNFFIGKAV